MTNQTKVSVNPGGLLGPFQCPRRRSSAVRAFSCVLSQIANAASQALPMGVHSTVRTEDVDGMKPGEVEIVIRSSSGKPAPAVTKDTVVTLGMLRELNASAYNEDNRMGLAIARKLAGK